MITGPTCPGCGKDAVLAPNTIVYGEKVAFPANLWICPDFPDCDYYISVWPDDPLCKPTGTMANARLRGLRSKIHAILRPRYGFGKRSKVAVYKELSALMGWKGRINVAALDEASALRALRLLDADFEDTVDDKAPQTTWHDLQE